MTKDAFEYLSAKKRKADEQSIKSSFRSDVGEEYLTGLGNQQKFKQDKKIVWTE